MHCLAPLTKLLISVFRKKENHIVTYEQTKLGLSAYYDKRVVHEDGIHTSCLRA